MFPNGMDGMFVLIKKVELLWCNSITKVETENSATISFSGDGTKASPLTANYIGGGGGLGAKPIKAMAGGGEADDPVINGANPATYTNNKLAGLGPRLYIIYNGAILTNWGTNSAFQFNPAANPMITGLQFAWQAGDTLIIDLNQ